MDSLGDHYTPRTYVVAETDQLSPVKVQKLEEGNGGTRDKVRGRRWGLLRARCGVLLHCLAAVAGRGFG